MTDHLPECCMNMTDAPPDGHCICDRLRACEQRVRLHGALSWEEGFQEGRSSAFDAAREAVAALEGNLDLEIDWDRDHAADPSGNTRNARIWLRDAVAAIDALREEQK